MPIYILVLIYELIPVYQFSTTGVSKAVADTVLSAKRSFDASQKT